MNIDGVMCFSVQYHRGVLHRHRGVACRIHPGHCHFYIITAFGQYRRVHRHFIAQRPVFIGHHQAGIGPAVHRHRNVIARLRIPGHGPADQRRHPQLTAVHDIIPCHGINADGVGRLGIQYHRGVLHRHRGVACRIHPGHCHFYIITAFGQYRRVHRHFIAQRPVFIGHHQAGKGPAVHRHRNVIARLRIPGHRPADQRRHPRFTAVHDIIPCHGINADGVGRLGIKHHGAVRHCSGFIAYRVMAYQRHLHIVSPLFESCGRHNDFIA